MMAMSKILSKGGLAILGLVFMAIGANHCLKI